MANTSERKRRGRPSPFGPKHLPPKSYALTKVAKRILLKAMKRSKTSESNVVEHLARKHGDSVTAADFVMPTEG